MQVRLVDAVNERENVRREAAGPQHARDFPE